MTDLLTAAQMRAVEAEAIASGAVTGLELMERAGRGVVEAIFAEWPELQAGAFRAVVLCGPGGNGGDGFVVARLLKEWGWEVEVFLFGAPERLPPDARVNYERWSGLGEVGEISTLTQDRLSGADLVVDALFGIGLTRALPAALQSLLIRPGSRLVAVDILSGICADSGRSIGGHDPGPADLTVTFHGMKPGHVIGEGQRASGKVRAVDLGLPSRGRGTDHAQWGGVARLVDGPLPLDKREGHKFAHGHALILCGASGQGGAARLAARGALRIGAGLVTLGCPPEALIENAAQLTAVMLKPLADAAALAEVLDDARITALCLGPGLGVARAAAMLAVALGFPPPPSPPHEGEGGRPLQRPTPEDPARQNPDALPLPLVGRGAGWGMRPVVLDADALTAIARDDALFKLLHRNCILTPHAGEFARLFPDTAAKLAAPATTGPAFSKVDACREAAARAGCVLLFKGADTVIAGPDGRCAITSAACDRAAPWLATAGSGDVLAGFITGLLARGLAPFDAACTAAWLHVECARSFGPGLIAEDLPEELPKVLRALGV